MFLAEFRAMGSDPTWLTLKKRSEYLRVRGGPSFGTRGFLLQAKMRERRAGRTDGNVADVGAAQVFGHILPQKADPNAEANNGPRFGFTITKKMGNAVTRNRIRRRLKAAVNDVAGTAARQNCDYVVVARRGAVTLGFKELVADLTLALERVHRGRNNRARKRRG